MKDGYYVNLGLAFHPRGQLYPQGMQVMLQSENGILGMESFHDENVDPDLINAGKQTVTVIKGAAYFSSADSFAMIRGGHVDLTVLGAFEVDQEGSIASGWFLAS